MKLNISDQVLAQIGKIVVVHSLIEDSLAEILGTIVSLRSRAEVGKIVTAELSLRQRVTMLSALLAFSLGASHECVRDFKRIKKLLWEADEQRNLVVHSVWAKLDDPDPHRVIRFKTTAKERAGLVNHAVKYDIKSLEKIASMVGDAYAQLAIFQLQFQKEEDTPA